MHQAEFTIYNGKNYFRYSALSTLKQEEIQVHKFKGISAESFAFMRNLKANNNRLWFQKHRQEWEFMKDELKSLCRELTPFINDLDPELETEPKTGRALGLINRDTRFSADKHPYRESVDLLFFHKFFGRTKAPGLAVGITPIDSYIGTWLGASMKDWRQRLIANIAAYRDVFQEYLEQNDNFSDLSLRSESYKKTQIKGLPPLAHQWAQRKYYYMALLLPADKVVSMGESFLETIEETFIRLYPLYLFATSQELTADHERFRRKFEH